MADLNKLTEDQIPVTETTEAKETTGTEMKAADQGSQKAKEGTGAAFQSIGAPNVEAGGQSVNTELPDIHTPKAFLAAALLAVDEKEQDEAALARIKERQKQLDKALTSLRKDMEKEKTQLVKAQRGELEDSYHKQLKETDKNINTVGDKRQKARTQGVKARIEEETEALREENKMLLSNMQKLFKEARVPAFCRTKLYYAWFMPRKLPEFLVAAVSFLLIFVCLPYLIAMLTGDGTGWQFALAYTAVLLLFGGAYLLIAEKTKVKHADTLKEGRAIRTKMYGNEKQIRSIKRSIKKDKDDTLYNLRAFDDELTRLSRLRETTEAEKAAALDRFDTVTKAVLLDEVESRYKEALSEKEALLSDATKELNEMAAAVTQKEAALKTRYGQYLGNENLTHAKIARMIQMIDEKQAETLSQAVSML